MCGITGWLTRGFEPRRQVLQAMTDTLAHRGPDAGGIWIEAPIGFGHRRLSVIDTGEAANQPMHDADGRLVITFNGEIYNYRELRTELEAHGHQFQTRSDTEVILESYKRWGTACLERFNGMFAFALWDRKVRRLFLARDRAGEKPLFYAFTPDGLVFASEPRALKRHPAVDRSVDPEGLVKYLTMNYVSGVGTLVANMRKLPPASYMIVSATGEPEIHRYWHLADHFHKKAAWKTENEAAEALTELIDSATRMRMVSDVPLGAFLSSGIDSATVVAAMAKASGNVRTFSAGFAQADYDESADARKTAHFIGVEHIEGHLDLDIESMLQAIVHAADEPLADNSLLPMWSLSQFARKKVTVALSGDGGDELFAGYETYIADRLARSLAIVPSWVWRGTSIIVDGIVPASSGKVSWDFKLRSFLKGGALGWPRAHYTWREIFDGEERKRLLTPERSSGASNIDPYADFIEAQTEIDGAAALDQALYVDARTWMVEDVLVKTDRMSMAHGLEVRTPFLDHRMMEFAASLPSAWKLKGFRKKHILKQSQQRRVPPEVLSRKKLGFNAPMSHWLRGPLRAFASDCLASNALNDWLRRDEIDRLWQEHVDLKRDNGFKLFGLMSLSLWLNQMREMPEAV